MMYPYLTLNDNTEITHSEAELPDGSRGIAGAGEDRDNQDVEQ